MLIGLKAENMIARANGLGMSRFSPFLSPVGATSFLIFMVHITPTGLRPVGCATLPGLRFGLVYHALAGLKRMIAAPHRVAECVALLNHRG